MDDERFQKYSIELDCPPGGIRPDDLIEGLLESTGLTLKDFRDSGTPFFGAKHWLLQAEAGKDDLYTEKRDLIKERVTALYNQGFIRHGSW